MRRVGGGPREPIFVDDVLSITGLEWSELWRGALMEGQTACIDVTANIAEGTSATIKNGRLDMKATARRRFGEGAVATGESAEAIGEIAGADIRLTAVGNDFIVEATATDSQDLHVWAEILCRCHGV